MLIAIEQISSSWLVKYPGEIAALSAASLWAVSSVIYGSLGREISPMYLNLFKGAIAIILLGLTLLVRGELFPTVSATNLCLLLLSGSIGIGLGDTAFFAALNCLGARRALLMETLAPPITAILALIFLQERLKASVWGGILLTVAGVAWVVTERTPATEGRPVYLRKGIIFGIIAAISLAIGGILARAAIANNSISPLWAALLRISAAVVSLLPFLRLQQNSFAYKPTPRVFAGIGLAAFMGTYLGIWLQQTAIKFTEVGIALTLTNTAPIFILPISVFIGEKPSIRAILGAGVAIFGIATIFYLG
ncbi:DMT family transporter [Synechocystis sp. PCC 7509]|uniref:DMT family transporter n=1 Tax=Synechocystis sp. PCC 7509 TaxID=927677 RepID=UPI0002ACE042|nr:DMT family transporter [Synechocystis sp. PCC 7509]